jgi:hypothetical protein
MQSELHCYTYRTFIGVIIARLLLPFLLLKYKDFWGLHEAALHSKWILIKKCYDIYVGSCCWMTEK